MNEVTKVNKVFLIILVIFIFLLSNLLLVGSVDGETSNTSSKKFTFKFDFGTGISDDRKLTIKCKIVSDGTTDYSTIIAMQGTLDYDKNVFEAPSVKGTNGFSGTFNPANNVFELDASGFTENQEIAVITLTAKNSTTDVNTDINITDIEIATGESDTVIKKDLLNVGSIKVPANSNKNENNSNTGGNAQDNNSNNTENDSSNNNVSNNNVSNNNNNNNSNNANNSNNNNNNSNNNNNNNNNNNSNNNTKNTIQETNQSKNKSEYISPVKKDATTSNKPIPQTGEKATILSIVSVVIIIGIITFIRYKKFYD